MSIQSPEPVAQQEPNTAAADSVDQRPASAQHPMKTGLWMLGAILLYYALQMWILPAAGVQT